MTKQVHILTSEALRERVEGAYTNGQLAVALKTMAYLSGVLAVCDGVAGIQDAAQFSKFEDYNLPEPQQRLDPHTLAYVMAQLQRFATQATSGVVMMEQFADGSVGTAPGSGTVHTTDDMPPPGTKLS